MVCRTNRTQNRIWVREYSRDEQMSFEVLLVGKKTSLLSIRAAFDRYLRSPPLNKKFSIYDGIQFNEANTALNSYLKHVASTGKIAWTIHKNPLPAEII